MHLFVLLLELIILLSQALDLTLSFLRFQLSVCLVLVVLSTQLVDFFTLFLRVIGNHLEVLLALLKCPLFLSKLHHFFLLHLIDISLGILLLGVKISLLCLHFAQQIVVLRLLTSQGLVVSVVTLDCLLKLVLSLLEQSFHLGIHIWLRLILLHHQVALLLLAHRDCTLLLLFVEHLLHEVRTAFSMVW